MLTKKEQLINSYPYVAYININVNISTPCVLTKISCSGTEGVFCLLIKSNIYKEQIEFENSDYFKERAKERYMIEAKNSELKHQRGYDVTTSSGLIAMQMQGALSIFTVNMKRIIKLKSMK